MSKPFLQRLHARVYAGSWKNPFFADPKVRDRSSERVRYGMYSLLVLMSCSTFFSAMFWFGTQARFAVFDVRVEGMRSVPNEQLALAALGASLNCSFVFTPCLYTWNNAQADVQSVLQQRYALENFSYSLSDHRLFLQLQEAVTMIPVRIQSQVWFATQEGILQREATPEDISAGIIIPPEAYSEIDVSDVVHEGSPQMSVLNQETFQLIASYKAAFARHNIPVTSFRVTNDAGKVIAYTQAGFAIYFTPWEDADVQVDRLVRVLAQASPQAYVDIRFGERIYVK